MIIVDLAWRCKVSIVRVMRQCQYCWIRIAGFTSDIRSRVKVLKMESVVLNVFRMFLIVNRKLCDLECFSFGQS